MCCKNISTVAAIRSLYFKYNMCRGRLLELFPRQSPDKLASLTTKCPAVVNAVCDAILNSPRDSDVHGRTQCIHSYESRSKRSKLVRGPGNSLWRCSPSHSLLYIKNVGMIRVMMMLFIQHLMMAFQMQLI